MKVVPEQEKPDSDFRQWNHPIQRRRHSNLPLKWQKHGADLILGTDPDADRVGVVVKMIKANTSC